MYVKLLYKIFCFKCYSFSYIKFQLKYYFRLSSIYIKIYVLFDKLINTKLSFIYFLITIEKNES